MFCIFNWALVAYTWFFIKEVSSYMNPRKYFLLTIRKTKGKSLEEMEDCRWTRYWQRAADKDEVLTSSQCSVHTLQQLMWARSIDRYTMMLDNLRRRERRLRREEARCSKDLPII